MTIEIGPDLMITTIVVALVLGWWRYAGRRRA